METPDNFRPKIPTKNNKKSLKGAWLFVVVTCLAIIIACLVPVLLGKNPLDLIFDPKVEKPQITSVEVKPIQNTEQSSEAYEKKTEQSLENKTDVEPLELVPIKEHDLKVDPYHGDAQNSKLDEGVLPKSIPQGLEASTPKATTHNRVTLRGDTLEQIEGDSKDSLSLEDKSDN